MSILVPQSWGGVVKGCKRLQPVNPDHHRGRLEVLWEKRRRKSWWIAWEWQPLSQLRVAKGISCRADRIWSGWRLRSPGWLEWRWCFGSSSHECEVGVCLVVLFTFCFQHFWLYIGVMNPFVYFWDGLKLPIRCFCSWTNHYGPLSNTMEETVRFQGYMWSHLPRQSGPWWMLTEMEIWTSYFCHKADLSWSTLQCLTRWVLVGQSHISTLSSWRMESWQSGRVLPIHSWRRHAFGKCMASARRKVIVSFLYKNSVSFEITLQ